MHRLHPIFHYASCRCPSRTSNFGPYGESSWTQNPSPMSCSNHISSPYAIFRSLHTISNGYLRSSTTNAAASTTRIRLCNRATACYDEHGMQCDFIAVKILSLNSYEETSKRRKRRTAIIAGTAFKSQVLQTWVSVHGSELNEVKTIKKVRT